MSSPAVDLSTLIAPKPVFTLYNPSNQEVSCDFGARTWRIPAKGTLRIGDIRVRGKDNAPADTLEAREILIALVGEDGRSGKLSPLGVRPLPGDHRDELVRQEADAAFEENLFQVALATKVRHMDRVSKEKAAGVAVTPPDKKIRDAMEYVARVERERGLSGAASCPECHWALASEADLTAHVANFHPELAAPGQGFGAERAPITLRGPINQEAKVAQVVAARPRPRPSASK